MSRYKKRKIARNEIYKNIIPPLDLLNSNEKKKLIENLNKLNFNFDKIEMAQCN